MGSKYNRISDAGICVPGNETRVSVHRDGLRRRAPRMWAPWHGRGWAAPGAGAMSRLRERTGAAVAPRLKARRYQLPAPHRLYGAVVPIVGIVRTAVFSGLALASASLMTIALP